MQATGARIVLIPHVVCVFNEGDDDLRYLRKVKQAIRSEYQKAVSLLEGDPGFSGAKRELIKCDLVIAARMHCAINAIAAHVPTILVAYSRKAIGMAEYVYGNRDWVLPLDDFATNGVLQDKVTAMKDQETTLRDYLATRIPEIQQDAYRPIQRLKAELEAS